MSLYYPHQGRENKLINKLIYFPPKGGLFCYMAQQGEKVSTTEHRRHQAVIPDPLEGIIEGNNRHERYANYVTLVLGKIWPPTSESGEYGDDFWRSARYDKRLQPDSLPADWISGYTQFSPQGRDPLNLTPEQFETVVENLGTSDYIRMRSIPPQIMEPGVSLAQVGGSCAIETNGMRTLADISAHIDILKSQLTDPPIGSENATILTQIGVDRRLLVDFAKTSVAMAPTVSHISGAMLGGYDVGIHYLETDMWTERLIKEFGITHAEAAPMILDAYHRIHDAVQRRSKLINPNSKILAVNFDELKLDPVINKWAVSMDLDLNDHRVIEVIYTYIGPEQLSLLKEAVCERQEHGQLTEEQLLAAETIMDAYLHVRGKQMDHLRWGSMNLPKEVIMGLRPMNDEEQQKFKTDYAYRMGVIIMADVYRRHTEGKPTSVALGFADLPAQGNGVQHESRDVGFIFNGQSPDQSEFMESVWQQLNNPARLNRLNVDAHLALLRRYTIDPTEQRKQLLVEMARLEQVIKPTEGRLVEATKKLTKVTEQVERYQVKINAEKLIRAFTQQLIETGENVDSPDNRQLAKQIRERAEKSLQHAKKKAEKGTDELTSEDEKDLAELPELIVAMQLIENGEKPILSDSAVNQLKEIPNSANRLITDLISQLQTKMPELELTKTEVAARQADWDNLIEERQQITSIREQLSTNGGPNLFPLRDNPYVHHAMQFLWDPDFVLFLKKAVEVQQSMYQQREGLNAQIKAVDLELETIREEGKNKGETKDKTRLRQAETLAADRKKPLKSQEDEIRNRHGGMMRQLMTTIYPKLEAYINYLYGRIDYPEELRNACLF